MPTQIELKKRDNHEQELKLTHLQYTTLRDNCRIFNNNIKHVLDKYEKWLKEHEMEPQINLEFYRKAIQ